ncbi:HPF/RaiA family ribosome-associated protein [Flaviaesturariibacter terrae]
MDIIIQSLGFKHSNELEGYIREKLEKKLKSTDRIVRANVTLFQGPDRNTAENYCEIRLEVPGPDLFVKEHSASYEQAVDSCIDVLASQMKRAHDKQIAHSQRNSTNDVLTDQLLAGDTEEEEEESLS